MSILSSKAIAFALGRHYSGSGDWLDESGNGHDATLVGAPTFNGDHFTLNGTTQAFNIADSDDFNIDTSAGLTAIVVARIPVGAADGKLIGHRDISPASGWEVNYDESALGFNVFINDGTSGDSGTLSAGDVTEGTKETYTYRYDGSANEHNTAVNGTFDVGRSATLAGTINTPINVGIGYRADGASGFLACDIFAYALFMEALTDAEVVQAGNELTSPGSLMLMGVG